MNKEPRIEWQWGVLAALAMSFIAFYPQLNLLLTRGTEWRGSYVLTQGDEVAYSAYVNALIDGRPRKNDPFNGLDDLPGKPADESLFSIQFVPAYAVALSAKALGLSTSAAFIWLLVISAFTSSLAIFWLLAALSGNSKLAGAGLLFTLCFGSLVGGDCCWQANAFTNMLPFLRRYQPSFVFPVFFVFCLFVWRALSCESARIRLAYSLGAGISFSVMVFSYFYVWTAAAAWFLIVALLWLLFRRDQIRRIFITSIVIVTFALGALIPFFVLLGRRNRSMDASNFLVMTRMPDLVNQPQIIGFIILGIIGYLVARELVAIQSSLVIFAVSFALLPFVLFNQQVLTGLSLQPIHYQVFIANYVVLISVFLVVVIVWRLIYETRPLPFAGILLVAIISCGSGMYEVSSFAKREAPKALIRDDIRGVASRLSSMVQEDGSIRAALSGEAPFPVVFTSTLGMTLEASMSIPTDSPVAVLWSLHSDNVAMTVAESKDRFYRHLYYSGIDPEEVEARINKGEFWIRAPLFGTDRVVEGLAPHLALLSAKEKDEECRRYGEFYKNFGRAEALTPKLNFVVVPDSDVPPNLENLDRWYERDSGQRIGGFTIFRVKLRT